MPPGEWQGAGGTVGESTNCIDARWRYSVILFYELITSVSGAMHSHLPPVILAMIGQFATQPFVVKVEVSLTSSGIVVLLRCL